MVAEAIDLKEKSAGRRCDHGEGKVDAQTLERKAPFGIAKLARDQTNLFMQLLAGRARFIYVGSFDAIYELARPPINRTDAMKRIDELLRECAFELGRKLAGISSTKTR